MKFVPLGVFLGSNLAPFLFAFCDYFFGIGFNFYGYAVLAFVIPVFNFFWIFFLLWIHWEEMRDSGWG